MHQADIKQLQEHVHELCGLFCKMKEKMKPIKLKDAF